ncbi:hypothetical protein HN865_01735 [Candidatus Woesearchaeota archaeon]|jgi:hypothetical protein|nr:hypothetical protein [Candidatus Woesearchaeota archaeon]MBT7237557.1 hypothetical protein [Candidatus Woesearchaeota archaeon]
MNLRKYIPRFERIKKPHFNDLEIKIRNRLGETQASTTQLCADLLINEPIKVIEACRRMDELGYIEGNPIDGINLDGYENPFEGYEWRWKSVPTINITFEN